MSDPNAPTRVSATVKFPESARYKNDNPWLVFEGSDPEAVRGLVIAAFNMTETDELTLADVVSNAQVQVNALGAAGSGLGGKVISGGGDSAWSRAAAGEKAESKPEKTPEEIEVERLTAEVEKVTTVAELQELWARNQAAFKDDALMSAYKAKGQALSAT